MLFPGSLGERCGMSEEVGNVDRESVKDIWDHVLVCWSRSRTDRVPRIHRLSGLPESRVGYVVVSGGQQTLRGEVWTVFGQSFRGLR